MKKKKLAALFLLLFILLFCGVLLKVGLSLWGITNLNQLTNPSQDALEMTWDHEELSDLDVTNFETMYIISQEIVDEWSSGAYLYSVHMYSSCENNDTFEKVTFTFLKVNRLGIYNKQWYAFVDLDLKNDKIHLEIWKELQDPPPSLQQRLDLDRLSISLPELLQTVQLVDATESQCLKTHISLYQYEWTIQYVNENLTPQEDYTTVKIDALSGDIH